jgi:hypothetical protein
MPATGPADRLRPALNLRWVDMGSDQALPDTSALARLSYELSLRTLTQQESSLNELRARTGTLIAAASVVTSFLGGAAIARQGIDVWSVLALVAFVASIGLATWVLLPKEHLVFSVSGSALFEDEVKADIFEIGETHRRLAYWLDAYHAENEPKVSGLFVFYRWATGAMLVEVVFWSLQLALS